MSRRTPSIFIDTHQKHNLYSADPCSCASELSTTTDQWREALGCATSPKYPEGKTVGELARDLGITHQRVSDQMAKALHAGTCKAYKDYRNNRLTTVYILEK